MSIRPKVPEGERVRRLRIENFAIERLGCAVFPHSLRVAFPHLTSPKGEGCVWRTPPTLGEVGRGHTLRSLISQLSCKPNAELSLL